MTGKIDLSLYMIVDCDFLSMKKRPWKSVLVPALRAGVTAVQLRCKSCGKKEFLRMALLVKRTLKKYRVPLIINDNVFIAKRSGAAGAHIGTCDMPYMEARRLLGRSAIIGVSASTEAEARAAGKTSADYVGLGPVFRTPNKKTRPIPFHRLKKILSGLNLPVVAIGGIKEYNIRALKAAGFKNFCFISEISGARNIFDKVKNLKERINDPA